MEIESWQILVDPETRYFSGLGFLQGETDELSHLVRSPLLIQAGAFLLDETTLAFPEKSRAKVEKELQTLRLIPRKV